MSEPNELIALRLWKADALEAISTSADEYRALDAVCQAQQKALNACADALHAAQCAISAYVEIKAEQFTNHPPKRRRKA